MFDANTHEHERLTDVFIDDLQHQVDVAAELCALASDQNAVIKAGDHERLLALVRRRQGLIDSLLGDGGLLATTQAQVDGADETERTQIRSLLDRLESLLSKVMAADERDQELLVKCMSETKEEMSTSDRVRVARSAYGLHAAPRSGLMPTEGRFTDNKG